MSCSKSFSLNRGIFYSLFCIAVFLSLALYNYGCSKNDYSSNAYNSSPSPTVSANEILIQNMSFVSGNKTISTGTTIKWTNMDNIAHTVTSGIPGSPSGLFDSGNINPQGTFSYTFNQAGVFNYYCKIHNSMTGSITVQANNPY